MTRPRRDGEQDFGRLAARRRAGLAFTLLAERLAVCRLDRRRAIPRWAAGRGFTSITRTADELSIVCSGARVPAGLRVSRGWRCLKLEGPFDFSVTGLVASFSRALARAGVSLMVICTFDTDYLLVRGRDLGGAVRHLEADGYRIRR